MREIFFKAKRIDNGKWVTGDLVHVRTKDGEGVGIKDTISHVNDGHFDLTPRIVHEETVCQYTGMDDINGDRIFQGDEVACHTDGIVSDKHIRDYIKDGHHRVTIDVYGRNHNVPMYGAYVDTDYLLEAMHSGDVVITGRNIHDYVQSDK